MDVLISEAERVLAIPLQDRNLEDLSKMSYIKTEISKLIPLAKKNMKLMELEADDIEKKSLLRFRDDKIAKKSIDTIDVMKAKARLNKNVKVKEIIELEYKYLVLYNFYQELSDAVVSSRLVIKNL